MKHRGSTLMIRFVANRNCHIKWTEFHTLPDNRIKQICYTWYPSEFVITKREAKKRIDNFMSDYRYDMDYSTL